ncbi:ABC transporter permease subunit [uncultured Ilyobacter sp.]|uniref:ABC transporter permease n=1 Tax=uncultured Ilyobacter sp. TaxID=544433 RepID=UPI0029F4748A|nr:ABC transporter permease subunit [uncultured Ilyobacter sp.]
MSGKNFKGVIFLLILWQLVSMKSDPLILPSPISILNVFKNNILTAGGMAETSITLYRFFIAYAVSVSLGILCGVVIFKNYTVKSFLWPFITIVQSTPVISWILLALLWFPSGMIPYFILGIFTLPVIIINTFNGLESTDEKLLEMAAAYEVEEKQVFSKIMLPSMLPSLMGGIKITANSSLKVLATAEIIGRLPRGIGGEMNTAWINIETDSLLAWTIYLIILTGLLEKLISAAIKIKWGRYL